MSSLELPDLVVALRRADALERFSAACGSPLLVVDLRSAPATGLDLSGVPEALAGLPCVVAALGDRCAPGLVAACDVRLQSEQELEGLASSVHARPIAATALVQLLRNSAGKTSEEGLFLESLAYSTLQSGPEFRTWLASRTPRRVESRQAGPAVRVTRDASELFVTLARPSRRNAFSVEMRDAFVEAMSLGLSDSSIGVVHLSGDGPSFSSGGDLDEFGSLPDPATAHLVRSTRSPARVMAGCGAKTRVRVQGACVGAGCELPAFAAHVCADPGAFFQLPEVGMGLVPGAGGTVSLPRRIGAQRTAWLAITGTRLNAQDALAWGLVDELAE